MPDVKGICQEECYVTLHYGLSFQKHKNNQAKNLPEDLHVFPFLQSWYVLNVKSSFFSFLLKNIIISSKVYQSMMLKGWCPFLL